MSVQPSPLAYTYQSQLLEAGLDEAGRGCLAGPVVAAAVILPAEPDLPGLTDSKKLSPKRREALRDQIMEQSLAWSIGMISPQRIDEVNILNATYEAMHEAIASLHTPPEYLAVDGNRFRPYPDVPHACLVRGDSRFLHIAAASVLAKTFRDDLMAMLSADHPAYGWASNKGYPTRAHRLSIHAHGLTKHHRHSFNWKLPLELFEAEG